MSYILKDNHHQNQQPPPGTGATYNTNPAGPGSGATTIHIPLSGNKMGSNAAAAMPPEVNRTTVWQQINKDGTSEQLIIPVTVKVRQINGNHSSTNAALSPRLSPMHEADEHNETPNKTMTTSTTTLSAMQQQNTSSCKEAAAKLEGVVVNTQTPANITPV
ncbi:GH13154 [Drosophila grimshawi]|uniref:GH13154 n=1 Tax=Drosophila grimshawi TaxID=7222 RepID=B4JQM8_DROGR|nr:GH13154 [Drosophila grimshawi]